MRHGWIVGILIVMIAGFAVWSFTKNPPKTFEIIPGVPSGLYSDSELDFRISYPTTATSSEVDFGGYLPLTQTPVISFVLPREMFAGTNLGEAGVYIGATTSPAIVATCTVASQDMGETSAGTESINGADFSVFNSTGVGAGNIYEEKTYRRVQGGACLEIVELLHSGNIVNYTPGAVQEFDHAAFSDLLESMVHTYRSL